ncbi:hypothetical protein BGW42_002320, partial [Actinomortierella wolfii]
TTLRLRLFMTLDSKAPRTPSLSISFSGNVIFQQNEPGSSRNVLSAQEILSQSSNEH